jgi:hypothetical protein
VRRDYERYKPKPRPENATRLTKKSVARWQLAAGSDSGVIVLADSGDAMVVGWIRGYGVSDAGSGVEGGTLQE